MSFLARLAKVVTALVAIVLTLIVMVPPFLDRVYYRGPVSGHFDGARFFNPSGDDDLRRLPGGGSRGGFLWRQLTGSDGRPVWPEQVTVAQDRPPVRVMGNAMRVTWVGHATVLVQTQGLNILTDPIWADRAGPFGIGPKRVAAPGIAFDALPPIDLVVVSHNHYDHMDLTFLKRLSDRDRPVVVTSLGNDTILTNAGVARAVALDWTQGVRVGPARVHVTRNHHWGSRWGVDRNRALWSSFVVVLPGGNLFFAGDTGFGDGRWPGEARALGPVRFAIIPIGAFRFVEGQMGTGSHVGPIEAAEIAARLGASDAIAIHWGTFRLSREAYDTPPRLLAAVNNCRGEQVLRSVPIGRPLAIAPYRDRGASAQTRADVDRCLATPAVEALK